MIACFMGGVQNIVAPQGTAFTADHARIIKRFVDEVVLCFDSDAAGQNAAVRALDSLLASGLAIRVATVPAPHDPDSFIKANGGPAFKQLIERAEGFFDYYLGRLCATHEINTDKGRLAVLRGMAEAVYKTENVVLIETYAQKTALRLGVSAHAVRAEFKKLQPNRRQSAPVSEPEVGRAAPSATIPAKERWLLRFLLRDDERRSWIVERLELDWLQHSTAKRIAAACVKAVISNSWMNATGLLDQFEEEARQIITAIGTEPLSALINVFGSEYDLDDPEATLKGDARFAYKGGLLERLRDDDIDRKIASLRPRAVHPETSSNEQKNLNQERDELRKLKGRPVPVQRELNSGVHVHAESSKNWSHN
jgi:DNA primase